ncbi:hypothetical protein [Chryseobacterium sp.]|uniref:hypothetical protein n=1 Tax=Chryseobacterium sp. TaxID=1871047 RepID=UPI001B16A9A1|nr:hypothetical protein [Chryseobacterium sp.]MBO9690028.1 RHS repeat protein [Chryseobacterium sp.]
MINNKIFTLLFCTAIVYGNAQQNNINKATNVVPPTPQADEMTRYGNQPLNEYKGMAQINIPIAEIKEKNIFNKVELNYSKLGVKVNDLPNNVGVSWFLDAGGVITRTINDLPDEMQVSSNRLVFNTSAEIENLVNIPDGSNNSLLVKSYFTDDSYDNEIDIFSISVNGLSGKFYLDKNLNPVLTTDSHQFKIETIGDFKTTHQFVLTTNDGVKYYFGGETAIEKTWIRDAPIYSGYTSFYLTKIINVENNEITFEYQNIGAKSFLNSITERKVLRSQELNGTVCQGNGTGAVPNYVKESNILRIQDARVLIKIKSKEKTINFNYNNVNGIYYNKISSIDIVNNFSNKKYQQISFEYLDLYSQLNASVLERFFLTKIKRYNFQGDTPVFDNEYSFSYDDPQGLPDKYSYSADVFGYFNNKFNSTLIPNLKLLGLPNFSYAVGDLYSYADRTSDFSSAKKGTLTSITYPTKGTTFFDYEARPQKYALLQSKNGEVRSNPYDVPITENTTTLDGSSIIDNQLAFDLVITQNEITSITTMLEVNLKILDEVTGSVLLNEVINLPKTTQADIDNGSRTKNKSFTFTTDPTKKYIVKLSLVPKPNVNYMGTFTVSYKSGYGSQNIAGLRLKKTYDVDENNTVTNVKRIHYSLFKDINNMDIIPTSLYPTSYITSQYTVEGCTGNMVLVPLAYNHDFESSELIGPFSDYFMYPSYPNVTISYGGDNFEKGGEQKIFSNGYHQDQFIIRTPLMPVFDGSYQNFFGSDGYLGGLTSNSISLLDKSFSYDDFNGKLLENRVFSKSSSGQLFLKSKTSNNYDLKTLKTVYDLRGKEVYALFSSHTNLPLETIISNYSMVSLPKESYYSILSNTKSTEYYENVPVDVQDDTSYKKLTTTTEYSYNNTSHYQLTSQKTTLPDQIITGISYRYAHDKANQKLITANMIGVPLETETTQTIGTATKTLSKVETKYDNPLNLLPSSVVSTDLQNIVTTEVTYDQYDSKGNLQQYTTKDGLSTVIIWGYNQTQPIAKIEGAKLTDIQQSFIDSIVTASNTDASAGVNNDETSLLSALNTFRANTALSAYQITTYTYDPLVGVRSITPPSGITESYSYDSANRLEKVVDVNGKVLKEMKYNYKN